MTAGCGGLFTTLGRGCVAVCGGSYAINGAGGGSVVDLVVRQQVDSQRCFDALTAKCAGVRPVTSNAALVVSFLLRGGSLALTSKLWLAALAPALDFISVASNLEAAAAAFIKPAADGVLDLEQFSSAEQGRSADPAFLQVLTQQGNHVRNSLVLTGEDSLASPVEPKPTGRDGLWTSPPPLKNAVRELVVPLIGQNSPLTLRENYQSKALLFTLEPTGGHKTAGSLGAHRDIATGGAGHRMENMILAAVVTTLLYVRQQDGTLRRATAAEAASVSPEDMAGVEFSVLPSAPSAHFTLHPGDGCTYVVLGDANANFRHAVVSGKVERTGVTFYRISVPTFVR